MGTVTHSPFIKHLPASEHGTATASWTAQVVDPGKAALGQGMHREVPWYE
jgi:hypothetical protein